MTLTLDLHLPHLAHTESAAGFSRDRRYRYWLTRRWGAGPALTFVGLHPSDADEHRDDATTRRGARIARGLGYDAVTWVNLYAAATTDPATLDQLVDPVGPDNDTVLDGAAAEHDVIVFAWGARANSARARAVATRMWRLASSVGGSVAVLGWTAEGQPSHPLEVKPETPLQCLSAGAHREMLDVDPRWARLLSDSRAVLDDQAAGELR